MEDMNKTQAAAAAPAAAPPVPRKLRGTLTIKADDDLEFRADRKTGISTQSELSHTREGKLYKTVGEKKNSMVAHIVLPADTKDPRAALYDQVDKLTTGMQTKAKPRLKGQTLMDEDNCRVILSKKESRVEMVLAIDLKATPNYNQALMNLMYKVSQCFAINPTSLASAR